MASSLSFEEIVASPTFKFLVGREHKPMFLHNALVAQQSKTLDTMMNGPMSEARDGFATLDDVEPKTFGQFSQWLYTGSHDSVGAKTNQIDASAFPARDTVVINETIIDEPFRMRKQSGYLPPHLGPGKGQSFYAADASKQQGLWASFSGGSSSEMPRKVPASERASLTDYNNYYLTHAQLYCFADKYSILGLQQTVIDKLKQNLIDYVLLSSQRIAALVKLIAFVSENTNSSGSDGSDRLRELVVQYTAITFEILFQNDDFQDVLATNGDFSLEVMSRLLRRLD